ncbi:MAG: hypothetical protein M1298_05315, partial [Chloroflexi bacterium]|nr:hypothetical protein [Chloroflexota bacterium]
TAPRAGQQGATQAMTYDELTALAQRSSVIADTFCEQVLGATVDSEEHWTGDGLAGIDNNGNVWVQTERWPVVEALSFQYGLPSAGGTTWTVASVSSVLIAGKARLVYPAGLPQRGWGQHLRVQYSYVNGWPSTTLTGAVSAGATSLPVAGATGIQAGQRLTIFDLGQSEAVTVAGSWTPVQGAASVSLASGTLFAHTPVLPPVPAGQQQYDIAVSALPPDIKEAVLLIAKALLDVRGSSSLVMGRTGGVTGPSPQAKTQTSLVPPQAEMVLQHYRRVV